jgi:hypothetical protein
MVGSRHTVVREAEDGDAAGLATIGAVEAEALRQHLRRCREDPSSGCLFLAEAEGRPLGYLMAAAPSKEVGYVFLPPATLGTAGLGSAVASLLQAVQGWARTHGLASLEARVRPAEAAPVADILLAAGWHRAGGSRGPWRLTLR